MTAIVGVSHAGRVYLGGDSAVASGDNVLVSSEPKVWKTSGIVIGAAGHLVALQALKHHANWPRYQGQQAERFLGSHVAPMMRRTIKTLRSEMQDNAIDSLDVEVLIGLGGKLFGMDGSGAFCFQGNAWAIGSGGDVANGVLFHTTGEEPEERITCALEAAEEVCSSVRSPFHIIWQD